MYNYIFIKAISPQRVHSGFFLTSMTQVRLESKTLTIGKCIPLVSIAKNSTLLEQEYHCKILDDSFLISEPVHNHYDSDVV